jgi:4-amino-4-deoxy-L-arabinose transferase and related glycosyltransferases of PMT family
MTTVASPTMPSDESENFSWPTVFWGLLLPLIVFAARSVRTLTNNDIPFDTKYNYLPFARQILENAHAFWHSETSLRAAPGISVYMALAGADITVIKMLNLALALGTVVLAFRISQRVAGNIAAGTTAWLMALSPLFVNLSILPQVEGLTFFLTTLWLWSTAWCLDRKTAGTGLAVAVAIAGFALTALTLTRATLMYWIPAISLFSIAAYLLPSIAGRHIPWLRIALIHCIALACIGAYVARNANEFGKPVIAAGAGAALYFGNLSPTHGQEPPYFGLIHDQGFITKDTDQLTLKGDERLKSVVNTILTDRPFLDTAKLYFEKAGSILFFSKSHLRTYFERIWRILLIVMGLAGAWFGRKQPIVLLVSAVVVYMLAVHIPVLYNQRYSVGALDVELMLLAGIGFGLILQQRRRWYALTTTLILLAASAAMGAWHQRYSQPTMFDTESVPLSLLIESSPDKVKFTGLGADPFVSLAPLTDDIFKMTWTDNFPVIDGYTLFNLKILKLKGECTKAWLSLTDRLNSKRWSETHIKSLRDGQDFNWGMASISSPSAGEKIELSLQCSRGSQIRLQSARLLEGTPGKYFLKISEK